MDATVIAPGIVTALLIVALLYVGRLAGHLQQGIAAQKDVVDTLRAHTGYVKDVHETVSALYEPKEVEKLVHVRLENARHDFEAEIAALQEDLNLSRKAIHNVTDLFVAEASRRSAYELFVGMIMLSVPRHVVDGIVGRLKNQDGGKELHGFVQQMAADMQARKVSPPQHIPPHETTILDDWPTS